MNWRRTILLIFLILVVFLIQQSLLINFWPSNLLLLLIIWLSCWQRPGSLLVAVVSGLLLDFQAGIIGPTVLSFILVNFLIISLSQHIPLEGFNHFVLASFSGIVTFFFFYYLFSLIFAELFLNKELNQFIQFSWGQFLGIVVSYQSLLIFAYLIRQKEKSKVW